MPSAYKKGDLQGYVRRSPEGGWRIETWEGEEIGIVLRSVEGQKNKVFVEIVYKDKVYAANAVANMLWRGVLREERGNG